MKQIFSLLFFAIAFLFLSAKLWGQSFEIQADHESGLLHVVKAGTDVPLITQNAKKGMRPFLHPIRSPDGKGVLTEIHPSHHVHQTGIYWGLKKVNGRDYFMKTGEEHYRYQVLRILQQRGDILRWQTVYDLINEEGFGVLRETQTWSFREEEGMFVLDLEWQGEALMDVKVEQFFVGGLFMRMPWTENTAGESINSIGEKNKLEADGHRAVWVDTGMEISGMVEWGHIAILDHPDNIAFPSPWRVDKQLGIGPSRQILGDWQVGKGETTSEKYRLLIYAGEFDKKQMHKLWKAYVCESLE